jgi:hypothetical protein
MAATQQSQAIQIANNLCAIDSLLMSVYQQMVALDAAWTDTGAATVIAAMATAPLLADGSLGTADVTPNVAHPIDTRIFPTVQHTLSSNQIGQIKTILDGIVTYVNGLAVTTQPGARQILNSGIGG